MSQTVTITEVGLRDGLQSWPDLVPVAQKIKIANSLIGAGVRRLEATSFVSPRAVPQLADAEALIAGIERSDDLVIEALVPNQRGGERAAGVDVWVAFMSVSETHSRANSNCSVDEAFERIRPLPAMAAQAGASVTAALAVSFDCPFEGRTPVENVVALARRFQDIGVGSLKLGDTIGTASPGRVTQLVEALSTAVPDMEIVLHFHNTRGLALANVMAGLNAGITRFESALGGLGGCPFAPGASGNVATEDVVHMLAQEGVATGIDLDKLIVAGRTFGEILTTDLPAHLQKAQPVGVLHTYNDADRAVG
ncbi:MAG: hydroxymethylglutaryl-CoA lyase [Pseudomonadota bacterium]